jgi:hypothetical protein
MKAINFLMCFLALTFLNVNTSDAQIAQILTVEKTMITFEQAAPQEIVVATIENDTFEPLAIVMTFDSVALKGDNGLPKRAVWGMGKVSTFIFRDNDSMMHMDLTGKYRARIDIFKPEGKATQVTMTLNWGVNGKWNGANEIYRHNATFDVELFLDNTLVFDLKTLINMDPSLYKKGMNGYERQAAAAFLTPVTVAIHDAFGTDFKDLFVTQAEIDAENAKQAKINADNAEFDAEQAELNSLDKATELRMLDSIIESNQDSMSTQDIIKLEKFEKVQLKRKNKKTKAGK